MGHAKRNATSQAVLAIRSRVRDAYTKRQVRYLASTRRVQGTDTTWNGVSGSLLSITEQLKYLNKEQ
ncbi:hypothetical protein BLA13014_00874 [Burkholderia aenigmatica]|uniref:Uncharacterized protein n=1 Tax=Burkholderia aenigmatica TaxID=2015348 RepID=A0A6P2I1T5_9BURK|nr:hypothetical protein BLA13014_00874 [Burkholderia aenigmatica]